MTKAVSNRDIFFLKAVFLLSEHDNKRKTFFVVFIDKITGEINIMPAM